MNPRQEGPLVFGFALLSPRFSASKHGRLVQNPDALLPNHRLEQEQEPPGKHTIEGPVEGLRRSSVASSCNLVAFHVQYRCWLVGFLPASRSCPSSRGADG